MRLHNMLFLMVAWSMIGMPAYAKDEKAITFVTDNPDFIAYISQGQPHDLLIDAHLALFNDLSFTPDLVLIPTDKIESMLDNGEPTCTFYRVKNPDRESRYIFSLATEFFLSHRLYQRASLGPLDSSLLNDKGEVKSLIDIFRAHPGRKLIVLGNRSYGEFLDTLIRRLPGALIYSRRGNNQFREDILMLSRGHGEYILSLPYNHTNEYIRSVSEPLLSYPLAGNMPYQTGHVMCNNTPATRAFIKRVNSVLPDVYESEAFRQAHLNYVDAASREETIRILDEFRQ